MKSRHFSGNRSCWYLAMLVGALFSFVSPVAMAEEAGNPSPAVTAASPAPAPAQNPAPADSNQPKVAAKKEEEEDENHYGPERQKKPAGSEEHKNRLGFLKAAVAKATGIPIEQAIAKSDDLESRLSALQAQFDQQKEELATVTRERDELNAFVDQLRTTGVSMEPAKEGHTLSPAQQAAQEAVSNGVAAAVRGIGQPAKKLPGPGADKPDETKGKATETPKTLAQSAVGMRAAWSRAGYVPPGLKEN